MIKKIYLKMSSKKEYVHFVRKELGKKEPESSVFEARLKGENFRTLLQESGLSKEEVHRMDGIIERTIKKVIDEIDSIPEDKRLLIDLECDESITEEQRRACKGLLFAMTRV